MICSEIHSSTFTNLVLKYMKLEWGMDNIWLLDIVLLIFSWIFFFSSFLCAVCIAKTPRRKKNDWALAFAEVWIGFTGIVNIFGLYSAHIMVLFPVICARFTLTKIIIYGSYEQFYLCEAYIAWSCIFWGLFSLSIQQNTVYRNPMLCNNASLWLSVRKIPLHQRWFTQNIEIMKIVKWV